MVPSSLCFRSTMSPRTWPSIPVVATCCCRRPVRLYHALKHAVEQQNLRVLHRFDGLQERMQRLNLIMSVTVRPAGSWWTTTASGRSIPRLFQRMVTVWSLSKHPKAVQIGLRSLWWEYYSSLRPWWFLASPLSSDILPSRLGRSKNPEDIALQALFLCFRCNILVFESRNLCRNAMNWWSKLTISTLNL